jgi:hypothetical protein
MFLADVQYRTVLGNCRGADHDFIDPVYSLGTLDYMTKYGPPLTVEQKLLFQARGL